MKKAVFTLGLSLAISSAFISCRKEGCTDPSADNYSESAKKDDGSCTYSYPIPTSYSFTNSSGVSTVDYSGQNDRLNQFRELMTYAESAEAATISAQILKDMFSNTNGNGNGNFSFTSTRQLKDKCFALDTALIISYFDSIANHSQFYSQTASNGQAGLLTSGTSTYLFSANGIEYAEMIEKAIMGGVLEYQALNVYFGTDKMNADNSVAVSGYPYTAMEHYWDEAFGYFAVPTDFPSTAASDFWGKYCNSQNATLNSNSIMMNNFIKGRAAIVAKEYTDRNTAISTIRKTWEKIAAYQAMTYLTLAESNFGTDQGKFLHLMTEAYGFIFTLRYAPSETRVMSQTQVTDLLNQFGTNFWNLTLTDVQNIKATLDLNY